MVIENQRRFLKRGVRIGIAFGTGVRRLVVLIGIFTVVDRLHANVACIACSHVFGHDHFNTVHFDNLRMFGRTRLVEIRHGRFFPSVSDHGQVHNLHLRFGDTVIQLAQPKPAELGFRKNRQIIATGRRNNRIELTQGNAPLAPTISQLFKVRLTRIGQINSVTDIADIHVQGTILVNIFGIVGAFTRVLFSSVNFLRRIAFVVQIFVVIIAGDIVRRRIDISHANAQFRALTRSRTAVPHRVKFIGATQTVKALVMQGSRRTNIVFTVIITVRRGTVNRKVFADKAQVEIQGPNITTSHHLDILHIAQVLVVAAVRAHNTAPGIARQVIVCAQRHLEHGQVLVIDIGIAHRRIDVLVQFRIVAVPNEFALVFVIQVFDVGRMILVRATRRRCMVPRKSRKRIRQSRSRRFKIFHKSRLFIARIRIVAARRKFSFITPAGLCRRVDARNQVHKFGKGGHGILQAEVHAPQHAGIRFVAESRGLCRSALALVQGGNAEHGSSTHAVQIKRKFGAGTEQQFVVDFEQRFAFVAHLDFLVRVKGTFTQKFNLTQFVVHFVVGAANKGRRTCRHLFGTRRNIHTGATAHRIARARVTHANRRTTALTNRFEIETVRVARKVIDR